MVVTVTNTQIIGPDKTAYACTMQNAYRFQGCVLSSVEVQINAFEPRVEEFQRVIEFLRTRVRSPRTESEIQELNMRAYLDFLFRAKMPYNQIVKEMKEYRSQ